MVRIMQVHEGPGLQGRSAGGFGWAIFDTYEGDCLVDELHQERDVGELEVCQVVVIGVFSLVLDDHPAGDEEVSSRHETKGTESLLANVRIWCMADTKEDGLSTVRSTRQMQTEAIEFRGFTCSFSFLIGLGRRAVELDILTEVSRCPESEESLRSQS